MRSAMLGDLVPAVRGEDDARCRIPQIAHEAEQPVDLAVAERRGRLVEEAAMSGFWVITAHDLDDLPLGEREVLDERARVDVRDAPSPASSASACLAMRRRSMRPSAPRGSRRRSRFSATVIHGRQRELLEHRPGARAHARRSGPCSLDGLALDADVPASGRSRPPRILISVLLPAPFSPTSACTSPRTRGEGGAVQRPDAAERLAKASIPQPPATPVRPALSPSASCRRGGQIDVERPRQALAVGRRVDAQLQDGVGAAVGEVGEEAVGQGPGIPSRRPSPSRW